MTDGQKLRSFIKSKGIMNKTVYSLFGMTRNNLHVWFGTERLSDKIRRRVITAFGDNIFDLSKEEIEALDIDIGELKPLDFGEIKAFLNENEPLGLDGILRARMDKQNIEELQELLLDVTSMQQKITILIHKIKANLKT